MVNPANAGYRRDDAAHSLASKITCCLSWSIRRRIPASRFGRTLWGRDIAGQLLAPAPVARAPAGLGSLRSLAGTGWPTPGGTAGLGGRPQGPHHRWHGTPPPKAKKGRKTRTFLNRQEQNPYGEKRAGGQCLQRGGVVSEPDLYGKNQRQEDRRSRADRLSGRNHLVKGRRLSGL